MIDPLLSTQPVLHPTLSMLLTSHDTSTCSPPDEVLPTTRPATKLATTAREFKQLAQRYRRTKSNGMLQLSYSELLSHLEFSLITPFCSYETN